MSWTLIWSKKKTNLVLEVRMCLNVSNFRHSIHTITHTDWATLPVAAELKIPDVFFSFPFFLNEQIHIKNTD